MEHLILLYDWSRAVSFIFLAYKLQERKTSIGQWLQYTILGIGKGTLGILRRCVFISWHVWKGRNEGLSNRVLPSL